MTIEEIITGLKVIATDEDDAVFCKCEWLSVKDICYAAIKALGQEPCIKAHNPAETDTWSLKDIADALKRNGIITEIQEPCEDAISREAVLAKKVYTETEEGWSGYTVDVKDIEKLPSVQPEQRTAHWIVHPKGIYAHLVCSNCLSNAPYDCKTNYCPNCGARMVEPRESEDKK